MRLREDIIEPIAGDDPSGPSLRLSAVYDEIKEARREDDGLAQGAWQHERKVADHGQAIRLAQDALATQSKDLQLAAWLCDSLVKQHGIRGLCDGLVLCQALLERFWETLYPRIDNGEMEDRLAPLEWLVSKLLIPIKHIPLCREGYDFFQYQESRAIEYEEAAKTKDQRATREKTLKEGKLAPELFDRSFTETPKAFYADLEKQIDEAQDALKSLDHTCVATFGNESAPSFTRVEETLQQVRHVVHQLLQKKRETEPDPVVEPPPPPPVEREPIRIETRTAVAPPASAGSVADIARFAPGDDVVTMIAGAAAAMRRRNPFSPAPYLMLRGLRWGELRGSPDPALLEAPPRDLRQRVKRLAIESRWGELLEVAEGAMALPSSRAWFDLQRLVVEACAALGDDYKPIAMAIQSELRVLTRDVPQLLTATLDDDTPAANPETQTWLRELMSEPDVTPSPGMGCSQASAWRRRYMDPYMRALEAMRDKKSSEAMGILQQEIERESCGRVRFQRKLQLAQICLAAEKDTIAQPLLDDIAASIETHKLDDWEENGLVAEALAVLMQSSKKIQGDAKVKQGIFERICRLDPVRALSV
jgi:type VI secretion system protein ImpA